MLEGEGTVMQFQAAPDENFFCYFLWGDFFAPRFQKPPSQIYPWPWTSGEKINTPVGYNWGGGGTIRKNVQDANPRSQNIHCCRAVWHQIGCATKTFEPDNCLPVFLAVVSN